MLFYSTLDRNGHLSPPKIGAKVAYISRKSDLRAESKICESKVIVYYTTREVKSWPVQTNSNNKLLSNWKKVLEHFLDTFFKKYKKKRFFQLRFAYFTERI